MTYLLSVAVGPVQEFIAAARRTRDLWFGSRLLSQLSKSAAAFLRGRGAELIFPYSSNSADFNERSDFTVVNKILARVDSDDMRGLAGELKTHVRQGLLREWSSAEGRARKKNVEFVANAAAQLDAFPEVYAAWTPLTENYAGCRVRVEELAAARKGLRDFAPHRGTAGAPKSSLDGGRENIIQSPGHADYDIRDNEYLDAIAVLKRFGGELTRFDSTLDVAGWPYARRLEKKNAALFGRYRKLSKSELGRESWTQLYRHESRQIYGQAVEGGVFEALRAEIYEAIGEPRPPYYALLIGDGDGMGKAISAMETVHDHQQFSEHLSGFASKAKEIVERHDGCPVYVGGDDVMALLPLHTALACAVEINGVFRATMHCKFSAGLAVAHALEPLSEVREIAHRAEHMAKHEGGKDALAVIVSPRSGSEVAATGPWDDFGNRLSGIVDMYVAGDLAQGFAYELRGLTARTPADVGDALPGMARRAAERKECGTAAKELLKGVNSRELLDNLIAAMLAARPFARAIREARDD